MCVPRHESFTCATWHTCMCRKNLLHFYTHSYVPHDPFTSVTRTPHTQSSKSLYDMTHWYVSHIYVTRRLCTQLSESLWHDSFICATWHIHMCDANSSWHTPAGERDAGASLCYEPTHFYLWHDAYICGMTQWHVSQVIKRRKSTFVSRTDMTQWHVSQDVFASKTRRMWDMTQVSHGAGETWRKWVMTQVRHDACEWWSDCCETSSHLDCLVVVRHQLISTVCFLLHTSGRQRREHLFALEFGPWVHDDDTELGSIFVCTQ